MIVDPVTQIVGYLFHSVGRIGGGYQDHSYESRQVTVHDTVVVAVPPLVKNIHRESLTATFPGTGVAPSNAVHRFVIESRCTVIAPVTVITNPDVLSVKLPAPENTIFGL